jgi:hypothetical protein
LLATPHYGAIDIGTTLSIMRAVKDSSIIHVPHFGESCSSVLPHAFNELLAQALMLRDDGRITHFAMIHADVEAPRGWLDTLYGEMWTRGLAAISAVIPIKNQDGRTSTSIGDVNNRWAVRRCIHLHEREMLPATFTAKDVCKDGELLLINTGLMLLDLRYEFWNTFAFQFHNRIVQAADREGNSGYMAQQRTEDWEMSHDLHAAGLPYGATWRVKVKHHGRGTWDSHK